jgi:hypothetical protein
MKMVTSEQSSEHVTHSRLDTIFIICQEGSAIPARLQVIYHGKFILTVKNGYEVADRFTAGFRIDGVFITIEMMKKTCGPLWICHSNKLSPRYLRIITPSFLVLGGRFCPGNRVLRPFLLPDQADSNQKTAPPDSQQAMAKDSSYPVYLREIDECPGDK